MSLLITSLDKDALPLAVGRATSKEIWGALTVAFSNPNTPRLLALSFALQNLVHKHDESVSQFLHRAKEISDELAAAGKPLPDDDFNIHIFRSLREDYQSVVPTMMYQQPPLTYSELHGLLMSHESLITSRRAIVDPSATASANLSQQGRGSGTPSPGRGGASRGRGRGRGFDRFNAFAHSPLSVNWDANITGPEVYSIASVGLQKKAIVYQKP
ncbi:uncharacterized protein LOC122638911 [Telopea speciosissima]|uniref:uncharacterized protein LOC122638911 n=1 Tax=Telopea speciosissima TaxID=54955 RepID=UPI001CC57A2C|nr:uncharacterized protein LOC122638911 [Telopea speciosissima]